MKTPPYRIWIAVMVFFTAYTNYMIRTHFSNGPTYNWDEKMQGQLLSAYFWGLVISSAPAGALAEALGPFPVIFYSSLASAAITAVIPISATLGPIAVYACRLILGLLGGIVYPAMNVLIAHWAPPQEKGKFLAAMLGNTMGTMVTLPLMGFTSANWGWHWDYYVIGLIMLIYCTVFFFVVSNSPNNHRCVSEEERTYIHEQQEGKLSTTKRIPPYLKIFTSCRFWAVIAAHFGNLWSLNLILTYGPKFMKETLGFNLQSSAGLAALPYLGRLIASFIFGSIGDRMREKGVMSVTKIRKFFIIFSHFIPAACMFLVRVCGCNWQGMVFLIIMNYTFNGACVVSHLQSPQDLSPNYAGTLFGLMNFIGGTTGLFVPPLSAKLTEDYHGELTAALIIYMIGGIMLAGGGLIFIIFGTGDVQSWNTIPTTEQQTT